MLKQGLMPGSSAAESRGRAPVAPSPAGGRHSRRRHSDLSCKPTHGRPGSRRSGGQGMEFHDYPLLSYQDLMLTVLKTAARGRATLQDCLAQLRRTLAAAHEHPPVGAADMLQRLSAAKTYLTEEMLLGPLDGDGFAITPRGR